MRSIGVMSRPVGRAVNLSGPSIVKLAGSPCWRRTVAASGAMYLRSDMRYPWCHRERSEGSAFRGPSRSFASLRMTVCTTFSMTVCTTLSAKGLRRDLRRRLRHVVPVDDRVEHHVELAVVLPAVDRVVRKHDHAAVAV